MNVRVEVVCINADGDEQRRQVLTIERQELAMEMLGMNLKEGKALLAGVQDFVVAQQAHGHLERHRACPHCRGRYTSKDSGSTPVSTVFGRVEVAESAMEPLRLPGRGTPIKRFARGVRPTFRSPGCLNKWIKPTLEPFKLALMKTELEGRVDRRLLSRV